MADEYDINLAKDISSSFNIALKEVENPGWSASIFLDAGWEDLPQHLVFKVCGKLRLGSLSLPSSSVDSATLIRKIVEIGFTLGLEIESRFPLRSWVGLTCFSGTKSREASFARFLLGYNNFYVKFCKHFVDVFLRRLSFVTMGPVRFRAANYVRTRHPVRPGGLRGPQAQAQTKAQVRGRHSLVADREERR